MEGGDHDPDFDVDDPKTAAAAGAIERDENGAAMPSRAKKKRKRRNKQDPTKTGDSAFPPEGGAEGL